MEPSKRMAVCTAASDRVRDQFDLEGQKNSFTEFFN
jgi:hypothetical protein